MANSVGLVLIQGAEALLADRAISEILSATEQATVTTLTADEVELGTITDSLAHSLFGPFRSTVDLPDHMHAFPQRGVRKLLAGS